jgi:hypothetical protein
MKRVNYFIHDEGVAGLEKLKKKLEKKKERVSVSELIRRAIDMFLVEMNKK